MICSQPTVLPLHSSVLVRMTIHKAKTWHGVFFHGLIAKFNVEFPKSKMLNFVILECLIQTC